MKTAIELFSTIKFITKINRDKEDTFYG